MITHEIRGDAAQTVVCRLDPGQEMYCEAGKFLWKTANIGIETRLASRDNEPGPMNRGLLGKALSTAVEMGKRSMAGESVALQHFTPEDGSGLCAFAGTLPGEMREIQLDGTGAWVAARDAFVAAESTVTFRIHFAGGSPGRRGGEGVALEKFGGWGSLFIAGAGHLIDLNPADYGGKIQVDTGCVVAFDDRISYVFERVGRFDTQGLKTAVFGGESFSLATLQGEGKVILQSVSMVALARSLANAAGQKSTEGTAGSKRGALGGSTDQ